jgi:outer membrane protein W
VKPSRNETLKKEQAMKQVRTGWMGIGLLIFMLAGWVAVLPTMGQTSTGSAIADSKVSSGSSESVLGESEVSDALKDRLELGLRMTYYQLTEGKDNDSDGDGNFFLGSINELEEEQSSQLRPYARYFFVPCFGFELSWEEMSLITRKYTSTFDTDGIIKVDGPALSLVGRYPNESRFTPYGQAGIFMANGGFQYAKWWHNGFPEYGQAFLDWQAMGSPPGPNNGYQRNIDISDETGTFLSGGCSIKLVDHLSLDFQARYMMLDVDAHYTLSFGGVVRDDRGISTFPLDNWAYQVGLKYVF